MIQATGYPLNITYAEKISRQYGATDISAGNPGMAIVDSVTISAQGRAMNEAISQAVNQGEAPKPPGAGGLEKLPDWSFNYAKASHRAEIGLQAAMQQLGIPAGTPVSLTTNTDGTITVTSDSPRNAELEAIVNNNPDLRNSIVAAQNSAYLGRIGNAVEQFQSAASANPAHADQYSNWLTGAVQRIMSMGFVFDFTDGKLNGSFLSNGQKIGLTDQMEKLAA